MDNKTQFAIDLVQEINCFLNKLRETDTAIKLIDNHSTGNQHYNYAFKIAC